MTENLKKDKDKQSGFSRVKMTSLGYVLLRASLALVKQLCSFGDVNCDHQIRVSSEDQKREETSFVNRAAQTVRARRNRHDHARPRAGWGGVRGCVLNAPPLAEEPVNERPVLAQTEQTFPRVLKRDGPLEPPRHALGWKREASS